MEDSHVEQRVARLEEQNASLRADVQTLRNELGDLRRIQRDDMQELKKDVKDQNATLQRIEVAMAQLAMRPACADPTACVNLKKTQEDQAVELKEIRDEALSQKGERRMLVIVWTIITALAAGAAWIISTFFHH